jgi:hypothetical protein
LVSGGPVPAYSAYLGDHSSELIALMTPRIDAPSLVALDLLFLAPLLAIGAFAGVRPVQYAILVALALLACTDLYQLLSFEGGDRKGCKGCLAWLALHAAFGVLATLAISARLLWIGVRRLRAPR